jgi:2-polyprenyl-3-methyl-5-hydroxy-6-metoxy-1,4-benzoquinol methylase
MRLFSRTGRDLLDIAFRSANESQKKTVFQKCLTAFAAAIDGHNEAFDPKSILRILLEMDGRLYELISVYAAAYDQGLHPKHRLIGYHDFFCNNIRENESVLDIGCGNGFLTSDIAKCTRGKVVGIDKNSASIEFATKRYRNENLQFVIGDVGDGVDIGIFDVVVLSNVLEHLTDRSEFLLTLKKIVKPAKFLIRVPMFEREWMVPFKRELGIDYRLDADHKIEYTQEQLKEELSAAGLSFTKVEVRWGEVWCCATADREMAADRAIL